MKQVNSITQSQIDRLANQLSDYAKTYVKIDASSQTNDIYAFVSELSMFRIAEKMRSMSNFSYGFSKPFNSHYIKIIL